MGLGFSASSQNRIIESNRAEYDRKNPQPCITIFVEPGADELKKGFQKYLKDNYAFKVKNKRKYLKAKKTIFAAVTLGEIDFKANVKRVSEESLTQMDIFLILPGNVFISEKTHPKEYNKLLDIVKGFYSSFLKEYYNKEFSEVNSQIENFSSNREKLLKKKTKATAKLEKNKKKITELNIENKEKEVAIAKYAKGISTAEKNLKDLKAKLEKVSKRINDLK